MRKRWRLLMVLCLLLSACGLALLSCNEEEAHTHTYSKEWESDDSEHWHAASCEHSEERADAAAHDWDAGEETTAPTEGAEGVTTYTCTVCGKKRTESIAALGHTHTFAGTLSYDADGHYYAATCGHESERKGYTAHTFTEEVTDPTCTAAGYTTYSCVCGYSYTDDEVAALEHDWVLGESNGDGTHRMVCANNAAHVDTVDCAYAEIETPPSCEEEGYTTYLCECGHSYTDDEVDALEHDWQLGESNGDGTHQLVCANDARHERTVDCDYDAVVTPPSCTSKGITTHTCECGDAYTENEIPATGHAFDSENWSSNDAYHWHAATCSHADQKKDYGAHEFTVRVQTVAPTCTTDGYTVYRCRCGKTEQRDVIEATGHDYNEFVEVPNSRTLVDDRSCKYAVTYTTSCRTCNTPQQKVEYVECHSFYYEKEYGGLCDEEDALAVRKPTCAGGENGIQHKHCANRNCKYYDQYAEAINYADPDAHSWVLDETQPTDGSTAHTCATCGAKKRSAAVTGGSADISSGALDEVQIDDTTITMNETMKNTLSDAQNSVDLSVGKIEGDAKDALLEDYYGLDSDVMKDIIGNNPIFSFNVTSENPNISGNSFGVGGKATVTVRYQKTTNDNSTHVVVIYIHKDSETGEVKLKGVDAEYWEDEMGVGYATFQTKHFSDYFPTSVKPEELCKLFNEHPEADLYEVASTCLVGGYTVCLRCGEIVAETPALGHKLTSSVSTAATCTGNGTMQYACAQCAHTYDIAIPAIGHAYVKSSTAASCKAEGCDTYTCIHCNDTYTVTVPQLPHDYETRTAESSCTQRGYTQRSCTKCGDVQTIFEPLLPHSFGSAWERTADGHYHICTVCGEKDELQAHVPGEEATEEHPQKCTECHYVLVPQQEHRHVNMTHFPEIEASCTESGNDAYYVCDCGEWFRDGNAQEPIADHAAVIRPATGHTREKIDAVSAGCTTVGYTEGLRCSACETVLRAPVAVAPLGHGYAVTQIKRPTCTEGGWTEYVCRYCDEETEGHFHKGEYTEALGHKYTAVDTAPGCETDGRTVYTCVYCEAGVEGHTYTVIHKKSAIGHAFGMAWVSDAAGHYRVCSRCDAKTETEAHVQDFAEATTENAVHCKLCGYEIAPMLDHEHARKETVAAKAASCTVSGNITYYVCACGEWFASESCSEESWITDRTAVILPATDHTLQYVAGVAPGCNTDGRTDSYTCEKCDYTIGGAVLPATGEHNFNTEPLYDADGHWHKCASCDTTDKKEAHSGSVLSERAPSCTEDGETVYLCSCGYEYSETIGKLRHSFEGEWTSDGNGKHFRLCKNDPAHKETKLCKYTDAVTDPSCTAKGYTTHTCNDCGYSFTDSYVGALGHSYGEWTSNSDRTHTRECMRDCAVTETVQCVYTDAVTEPTCLLGGYTTHTCLCGDSYVDAHTPAHGHSYGEWKPCEGNQHIRVCKYDETHTEIGICFYDAVVTAPSCTEGGYTTYTCPTCGHSYTGDETPATDHTWQITNPLKNGKHEQACQNGCGSTETVDCDYNAVVTAPSCTEGGYTTYTCECGHSKTGDETDPMGHSFANGCCTLCGEQEEVNYQLNTIFLETVYDTNGKAIVSLVVKNADLAGIRLRVGYGPYTYEAMECRESAVVHDTGDGLNVLYSGGENTVSESLVLFSMTVPVGDGGFDAMNCSIFVQEIYRFDATGSLEVPAYILIAVS